MIASKILNHTKVVGLLVMIFVKLGMLEDCVKSVISIILEEMDIILKMINLLVQIVAIFLLTYYLWFSQQFGNKLILQKGLSISFYNINQCIDNQLTLCFIKTHLKFCSYPVQDEYKLRDYLIKVIAQLYLDIFCDFYFQHSIFFFIYFCQLDE